MTSPLRKAALLALALVPALATAEQKIGVVDLQRALNEVDEGKAAKALLKKDFDEKQKQLDARKAEFDKLQADFDRQSVVMSEAAKKDKFGEIDRRARELQGLYMQLQKDLSERERDATKGIYDRMANIVREIAEAEGFTAILERPGVVYAANSLDITNELIRKYNSRHPAPGGGAAAPKKSEGKAKGEGKAKSESKAKGESKAAKGESKLEGKGAAADAEQ